MRILFVLEHYHPYIGGVETLFWELSRALVREGHQVEVVTTRFRKDLAPLEEVEGVCIRRVRCHNRFLFSFLSLPEVVRRARYADLVQTTSYNAALPAWLGAMIARKPTVITFHEVWGNLWHRLPFLSMPLRFAFRAWEWLILKLPFDQVIAVSDATRKALLQAGLDSRRISRIYNGLDYTRLHGLGHQPPSDFVFTYFGRLGASKGLDLLIPAAVRFLRDYPDARFRLIIPRYPAGMFRQVTALLEDGPTDGRIQLMHDLSRTDLETTIRSSSCVVIPSYSEGFCFVAAESVALGVPVISSGRTALREVVGGQYLDIDPLSAEHIYIALEKARRGAWQHRPAPLFPLEDSVKQYILLYEKSYGQHLLK